MLLVLHFVQHCYRIDASWKVAEVAGFWMQGPRLVVVLLFWVLSDHYSCLCWVLCLLHAVYPFQKPLLSHTRYARSKFPCSTLVKYSIFFPS